MLNLQKLDNPQAQSAKESRVFAFGGCVMGEASNLTTSQFHMPQVWLSHAFCWVVGPTCHGRSWHLQPWLSQHEPQDEELHVIHGVGDLLPSTVPTSEVVLLLHVAKYSTYQLGSPAPVAILAEQPLPSPAAVGSFQSDALACAIVRWCLAERSPSTSALSDMALRRAFTQSAILHHYRRGRCQRCHVVLLQVHAHFPARQSAPFSTLGNLALKVHILQI